MKFSLSLLTNRFLLIIISLVFLLMTAYFYSNKAFSFHFVDEEDNFVLGKYLLTGDKLYQNLFSHHQPVAYILSAQIQNLARPQSVYSLIKDHRRMVIVWSIIWSLLLVIRFGPKILAFIFVYELSKIYLLGNLFLSESLVVYPLIYLVGCLIQPMPKTHIWESFLIGFCLSLCLFLLSPIWPVLLMFSIIYFRKIVKNKKALVWTLLGITLPTIVILNYLTISDYLYLTWYINFKYYIPSASPDPIWLTVIKAFFAPVLTLLTPGNAASLMIAKVASVLLLLNLFLLIRSHQRKLATLIFSLLGLANIRFVASGQEYYNGFHLLPWFSLIILCAVLNNFYKNKLVLAGLSILILVSFQGGLSNLFIHKDEMKDYYINYSRQITYGTALNILKASQDKLFVAPDEWLVYWAGGDIDHASKMVNYYAWMDQTPPLHNIVHKMFLTNPPTFFYKNAPGTNLEQYLGSYVELQKDGKPTELYMRTDRYDQITSDQKAKLNYLGFEL